MAHSPGMWASEELIEGQRALTKYGHGVPNDEDTRDIP